MTSFIIPLLVAMGMMGGTVEATRYGYFCDLRSEDVKYFARNERTGSILPYREGHHPATTTTIDRDKPTRNLLRKDSRERQEEVVTALPIPSRTSIESETNPRSLLPLFDDTNDRRRLDEIFRDETMVALTPTDEMFGEQEGGYEQIEDDVWSIFPARECFCSTTPTALQNNHDDLTHLFVCPYEYSHCAIPVRTADQLVMDPSCLNKTSFLGWVRSLWPVGMIWYALLFMCLCCTNVGKNVAGFCISQCYDPVVKLIYRSSGRETEDDPYKTWNERTIDRMLRQRPPFTAQQLLRQYARRRHAERMRHRRRARRRRRRLAPTRDEADGQSSLRGPFGFFRRRFQRIASNVLPANENAVPGGPESGEMFQNEHEGDDGDTGDEMDEYESAVTDDISLMLTLLDPVILAAASRGSFFQRVTGDLEDDEGRQRILVVQPPKRDLVLKTRIYHAPSPEAEIDGANEATDVCHDVIEGDEAQSGGKSTLSLSSSFSESRISCSICFMPIHDGDRVGVLNSSCNHLFHVECLKSWLTRRNTCPLCQAENVAEERIHPAPAPTVVLRRRREGIAEVLEDLEDEESRQAEAFQDEGIVDEDHTDDPSGQEHVPPQVDGVHDYRRVNHENDSALANSSDPTLPTEEMDTAPLNANGVNQSSFREQVSAVTEQRNEDEASYDNNMIGTSNNTP